MRDESLTPEGAVVGSQILWAWMVWLVAAPWTIIQQVGLRHMLSWDAAILLGAGIPLGIAIGLLYCFPVMFVGNRVYGKDMPEDLVNFGIWGMLAVEAALTAWACYSIFDRFLRG